MFGQIRTMTQENGEIMFVGKDVAQALGYSNTRDALSKHVDADDKLESQIATSGQRRAIILINESGLSIVYWQSGEYMLYADYARRDYARNRSHAYRDLFGELHTRTYLVWTERGREFIHRKFKNFTNF